MGQAPRGCPGERRGGGGGRARVRPLPRLPPEEPQEHRRQDGGRIQEGGQAGGELKYLYFYNKMCAAIGGELGVKF